MVLKVRFVGESVRMDVIVEGAVTRGGGGILRCG
jgi:hypothetical protein